MHDEYEKLLAVFFDRGELHLTDLRSPMGKALLANPFEDSVILEPVYAKDGPIGHEALSRPRNVAGVFSIAAFSETAYKSGAFVEFDLLTTAAALQQADEWPISINISVISALSPEFWYQAKQMTRNVDFEGCMFEILEHDVDPDTDISLVRDLKDQGYIFALDDFSGGQSHDNRLAAFGDIVEYIKLDGKLVRGKIDGTPDEVDAFDRVIAKITDAAPHAKLIAEHVHDRTEADLLFRMGVHAVQGRDLNPKDFSTTPTLVGQSAEM